MLVGSCQEVNSIGSAIVYRWIVDHGWRGRVSDVDMMLSKVEGVFDTLGQSFGLSFLRDCNDHSRNRWRKFCRDSGPSSTFGYKALQEIGALTMLTLDHLVMAKEADQ